MMFDAEVKSSDVDRGEAAFTSRTDIEVNERFVVELRVHLTRTAALGVSSKMFSMPAADLTDEDCESTAGELGNLLMGRMVARFRDRSLTSTAKLPVLEPAGPLAPPDSSAGLMQAYALPTEGDFFVSVRVIDRLETANAKSGKSADAAASSAA